MSGRNHSQRRRKPARRILIRRVDNLGDNVLALPVVREIRRHHPAARVTVMARPEGWDLYHGLAEDFISPEPVAKLEKYLQSYDQVFNIECSFPEGYVPAEAAALGRVQHVGTPSWRKHLYRGLLDGLALHGYEPRRNVPKIRIRPADAAEARQWLDERFRRRHRPLIVAVNPSAGYQPKEWALESFVTVCDWLVREFDAHLVLLGHRKRDREVSRLHAALPDDHHHLLTGQRIGLVAAILAGLDMHIGNDSGTGHVAAAVGLPTVTIFGPTASNIWRPAGRKAVIIQDPGPCLACGYEQSDECKDRNCLARITPSHMADGILLSINKHLRKKRLACLDPLQVSDRLHMVDSESGVVIRNTATGHACLISTGEEHVVSLLETVRAEGSYRETLRARPGDRDLVHLLWMHRILGSGRQGKGGGWL